MSTPPQQRGRPRARWLLVVLFLYAPIVILIVFSFNAGNSSSVWKGFSLHWYAELLHNRLIMHSVYTTLLVSLLATVIATIAGTFAAIGFYGMRRRGAHRPDGGEQHPHDERGHRHRRQSCACCSWCSSTAGTALPYGLTAGSPSWSLPERLTLGFGTLLIAHVCFNIPYVILSVGPKLRQMDRNLIDAAQDLGCTWMQAFWKVIIPEIKPGIVSGALIGFHHEHRRLHHQLLHGGHLVLHAGHDHLRHDQKAGQPGDQRRVHAAVRHGASSCWPSSICGRTASRADSRRSMPVRPPLPAPAPEIASRTTGQE